MLDKICGISPPEQDTSESVLNELNMERELVLSCTVEATYCEHVVAHGTCTDSVGRHCGGQLMSRDIKQWTGRSTYNEEDSK